MPVIDFSKDIEHRSVTITAQFAAPVERIWELYADPRQLERVWGPPDYPATFVDHDLRVGGRSTYYMKGPEGEKYAGYWLITDVEEPQRFSFDDGFAHDDFTPNEALPVGHNDYSFAPAEGGTRATFFSVYDTVEGLQQVLDMGAEEGATLAINQIDDFLAKASARS